MKKITSLKPSVTATAAAPALIGTAVVAGARAADPARRGPGATA